MRLFRDASYRSRYFSAHGERSGAQRFFFWLLFLALMAASAAGVWLFRYATTPFDVPEQSRQFHINQGQGLSQVARSLAVKSVIGNEAAFVILARLLGKAGQIKAGSYEVPEAIAPLTLLRKFEKGDFAQGQVRFIEGWTFRQMRAALDGHPGLRHDTRDLAAAQILQRLEAQERHPEGLFFPDTYYFAAGTSDLAILRQAYSKMQQRLAALWPTRVRGLPLSSPYEALVLASIVEKETGVDSEREMIAAVFVNRLKRGIRLQADPTVIYGLGESFDGNLRKRDLLSDQPYNSYTRAGLPPTPIAMPGEASLHATLNPARSAALYFVARGDGSHEFSDNLVQHNRAVDKYQRLR
jgi:UPF0755 protein